MHDLHVLNAPSLLALKYMPRRSVEDQKTELVDQVLYSLSPRNKTRKIEVRGKGVTFNLSGRLPLAA
jgi:hypothetical protein